ncbi:MAG: VWA domain-containing protein [Acidobacteriota bacterium]|nr:VWA domain-containing protein [Acidobacteriota bacterium]
MRNLLALLLTLAFLSGAVTARQTAPARPAQDDDEVVRITSALVQTDVVVTDKNERIIPDLKIEDFELYENGKRQDIKFLEFVSVDTGRRVEGAIPGSTSAPPETEFKRELDAAGLKRVVAFVVDDLTIPHADLITVRQVLRDFVDNQMREGDLVAIVRVIGGKGLLQQFTTDKQLLRRAIASLNVATNPFAAFDNPPQERIEQIPKPIAPEGIEVGPGPTNENPVQDIPNDTLETNRLFRGLFSLATANYVIESLKQIPGRKSLVLFSGGVPIFETQSTGTIRTNVTELLNRMTDNAVRAGVSISTMDPRGLRATPGVAGFEKTPGRGGLRMEDPGFGRGGVETAVFGPALAGAEEHLSLQTLSNNTGGVSVVNTNNFKAGLEKILARSAGYYLLAYTPTDKFDNKFRKLSVRVKREGLRVYGHRGYLARDAREEEGAGTKEQAILAASRSPLAKREVELSSNLTVRFLPNNRAALDIDLVIDPRKLTFTQGDDGKQKASFDVVGFVYDQVGKLRGGFSETVNIGLTPENLKRALTTGVAYSANTELPPGYYQLRTVVREASTGRMGTTARYLEIPDLKEGRLAMSSILLYGVDAAKGASAPPQLLGPLREISRTQDLRYAATIYNAKREGSKHQLRSQIIISQGDRILFREPEQPLTSNSGDQQVTRIGQIGLSKVPPGRYVLTLVVTDPLADKKSQRVVRSTEFNVIS